MEFNFNNEQNKTKEKKSLFDPTEPIKKLSLFSDNTENSKSLFGDLFTKNTESNLIFNNVSLFGNNNNVNNNSESIFGNKSESLFGNYNLSDNKNKNNIQKKKENKKLFDDNEYEKNTFSNITLFEDTEVTNSKTNKKSLFGDININKTKKKKNNDSEQERESNKNNSSDKSDNDEEEEESNDVDGDGYENDDEFEEDEEEEEENENNKLKNKNKNKSKKKKEKNKNEEEESSSSNYHPEKEKNFYDEVEKYMSSDSEPENNSGSSKVSTSVYGDTESETDKDKKKKKICDHLKLVKEKRTLRKKKKKSKINKQNNNDDSNSDNDEENYDESAQLFKENELKTIFDNTFLFEKNCNIKKKKKTKLFDFNMTDTKETKENKNDSESKSESKDENEEDNELTIEFCDKFKGTDNNLSLNYYTKKTKLENLEYMKKVNFDICKRIKNSDNYLMYNENKEKLYAYNSKKRTIISKSISISSVNYLFDRFFLVVDFKEDNIFILHYDEKNNKFIIDQTLDFPEQRELDIHGPFAPYLNFYPFNEKFILFHWDTSNNFYIYKNCSKDKDKIEFKNYKNIDLDKEAFVYVNTKLNTLLKINDNDFMIYAVSDQRPESDNIWEAFMRGASKHKEASYIGIYSYDNKRNEFILIKSKVIYEGKSDYSLGKNKFILRERFFIYSGQNRKTYEKYIQIFDLKTMQIVTVINIGKNGFFTIDLNNMLFIRFSNIIKQYEIKESGFMRQIGEIKINLNCIIYEKRDNGFIYEMDNDFYLLEHN